MIDSTVKERIYRMMFCDSVNLNLRKLIISTTADCEGDEIRAKILICEVFFAHKTIIDIYKSFFKYGLTDFKID